MTRITKLLKDGSGALYSLPSGSDQGTRKDTYFRVPFAYWEQHYYKSLSMPAKAMLFIFMAMRNPSSIVMRKDREFAAWYGVSPSTVSRGIAELKAKDLLYEFVSEQFLDGSSVFGQSTRVRWALAAPFDLNINKKDRETAETAWTRQGAAATALRIAPTVPVLAAALPPR